MWHGLIGQWFSEPKNDIVLSVYLGFFFNLTWHLMANLAQA